jgi:N utilization substance protein B
MQIIYGFKDTDSGDINHQEHLLLKSMENMYDLYLLLLSLMIEVQLKAKDYLTKSQQKHLATQEEKNPNYNFVNNKVLIQIKENTLLSQSFEARKIDNWKLDNEYVEIIFKAILNSGIYRKYILKGETSFDEDREFLLAIFKNIIAPNDKLYEYFEDKNITWIDDFPVVNTLIVKILKKIKPDNFQGIMLPDLYKDEEDKDFGLDLLKNTLSDLPALNDEIIGKTTNWDKDRIANVDLVLLQLAITEFQRFPTIPIKVTINEYLEIAKEYSTPKSSVFINGILDKLVKEYEAKGKLNKSGRGLK